MQQLSHFNVVYSSSNCLLTVYSVPVLTLAIINKILMDLMFVGGRHKNSKGLKTWISLGLGKSVTGASWSKRLLWRQGIEMYVQRIFLDILFSRSWVCSDQTKFGHKQDREMLSRGERQWIDTETTSVSYIASE